MTDTNNALLIKIKVKLKPVEFSNDTSLNNFISTQSPEFEFIVDEQIQIDNLNNFDFYSENNFDFAILQQNADYLYLVNDLDTSSIQYVESMDLLYQYLCRLFSKDIFQNSIHYAGLYNFLNKIDISGSKPDNTNPKLFTSSEMKTRIMNHYNSVNFYRKKSSNKLFNKIAAIPSDIIVPDSKTVDLSNIKDILFDDFVNEYKSVIIQNISNNEDWNLFIKNLQEYKRKKDLFNTSKINEWLSGYGSDYIDSLLDKSNIDNGVIVYLKLNNKDIKPGKSKENQLLDPKLYNSKRFDIQFENDQKTLKIGYNNDNTKYDYSSMDQKQPDQKNITNYVFGKFNNIFLPTQTNLDIVEKMTEVIDKVSAGNPVFIIGYGASGAGKTSSLIYLKTQKEDADGNLVPYTENGVLPVLCSKIVDKSQGKIRKLIVKTVEFFESDHDKGKNGAPKTMIMPSEPFAFGSDLKLLSDVSYKNKHTYIVDKTNQTFAKGTPLGECITHLVDTDRYVKATTNNPQSSRSHVLVFVNFCGDSDKIISQIIVGDFAGVENQFQCKDTLVLDKFLNIETSTDKTKKFYETQNQSLNEPNKYDYYSGGGESNPNVLSQAIAEITGFEQNIKENSNLHLQLLEKSINKENIDATELFNAVIKNIDTSRDINENRKNIEENIRVLIESNLKRYKSFFKNFDKIIGSNPYDDLNETKIDYNLSNALYKSITNRSDDMGYPSLDLKNKNTIRAIHDAVNKFKSFITEFYNTYSFNKETDTTKKAIYTATKLLIVNYFEQIKDDIFKGIIDDPKLFSELIGKFTDVYDSNQKNTKIRGKIIPDNSNNMIYYVDFQNAYKNPFLNFHYFLLSLISLNKPNDFFRSLKWETNKKRLPLSSITSVKDNIDNNYGFYYNTDTNGNKIVTFTGYSVDTEYISVNDFIYGNNTTDLYSAYKHAIFTFVNSIYTLIDSSYKPQVKQPKLQIIRDKIIKNLDDPSKYNSDIKTIKECIDRNFDLSNNIFEKYIPILEFQINNAIDNDFKQNIQIIKPIAYNNVETFVKYKSEIEHDFIGTFINQKVNEVLKYVYIYYSCKYRVTEGKFINRSLKIMRNTIGTIVRSRLKNFYNYLDKCYDQYILDFKRLHSSRGSTSQDKIIKTIFDNMHNMEKFKDKKDDFLMQNLSICIFGVLNITKNANNPPESPYVDINNLKTRIKKKNYVGIHNELKSLRELLNTLNINDLHSGNIDQLDQIDQIIKKNKNSLNPTDYDTVNDLIDIKDNIDNLNASSAIGTLEFLDQIVKLNSTSILCRDPAPSESTYISTKK